MPLLHVNHQAPRPLEISEQMLPLFEGGNPEPLAPSAGLDTLRSEAPASHEGPFDASEVWFPFSNDESARYFEQTAARTLTPEYRVATNRVALLVGESGLAANIENIPEDTILMVDESLDMCLFMDQYYEALKTAATPEEWLEAMGFQDPAVISDEDVERFMNYLLRQQVEFLNGDKAHPAHDQEAFLRAQSIARKKTFITWHADFTNEDDMQRLGDALRLNDAHITFANFTNAIPYSDVFNHASEYAEVLESLPFTPNAPILTTARKRKQPESIRCIVADEDTGVGIVEATGPFFGLENLATAGGGARDRDPGQEKGALVERKYSHFSQPQSYASIGGIVIEVLSW